MVGCSGLVAACASIHAVRAPSVMAVPIIVQGATALPRARRRPGTSCSTFERAEQEACVRESLEATAGDVAVDSVSSGEVVGGHRQRLRPREEERLAKLPIAYRLKPMSHHL